MSIFDQKNALDYEDFQSRGVLVNTPLDKAILKNKPIVRTCIDYLTFSFPCNLFESCKGDTKSEQRRDNLLEALKLNINEAIDINGRYNYGYGKQWTSNHVMTKDAKTDFLFGQSRTGKDYLTKNKNGEQTALFELSGSALREFEERSGNDEQCYKDLYDTMLNSLASVTRIDVAIDIFDSPIDIVKYLKSKDKDGLLISKFRNRVEMAKKTSGALSGNTFYLGQLGKSDMVIRVYDKMAQYQSLGLADYVEYSSWYRIEFECKHEIAKNMIIEYFKHIDQLNEWSLQLVNNYIQPKAKHTLYDLYKEETDPIWLALLDISNWKKTRIPTAIRDKTDLEVTADWAKKSLPRVMAKLMCALGVQSFESFVKNIVFEGFRLIKNDEDELRLVNDYRIKHGKEKISLIEMEYLKQLSDNYLDYMKSLEGENNDNYKFN